MEIDTYYVICPYCQSNCGNGYDLFEDNDDGFENVTSDLIECDNCNKKFYCRKVITVDYRTEADCSLNDEKHEKGKYHCKKCDVYNSSIEQEQSK